MKEQPVRRRYRIEGMVQGVGFRYRAQKAANLLGLSGWVENCWDGSVELEVQGPAADIDRLLPMVEAGRWVSIQRAEYRELPPKPGEYGFYIK